MTAAPSRRSAAFAVAVATMLCSTNVAAAPDVAVIDEINRARTHPAEYAEVLVRYRGSYHGRLVDDPSEPGDHLTREGVAAVDEAIRFLRAQPPLRPLAPGPALAGAAADHAAGQGKRGDTGHLSPDGATPGQRVARRGGGIYVSEAIAYGSASPLVVVRQLIVDDGVADRGHRHVLFDDRLGYAGAGCGPHPVYGAMCVIDLSPTPDGRPPSATRR